MRIGFDAKRIFFNGSGLGNYSRSTVELLDRYTPGNDLVLFSPKPGNRYGFRIPDGVRVVYPDGVGRWFPSWWRSCRMSGSIRESGVDIFHGLSNELPADIRRSGVKSVVTIHDLIFERYPGLYRPLDRKLYRKKYRRSAEAADRVIAISLQTKNDLVEFWGIDPDKIDVVYQGCSPIFYDRASAEQKRRVQAKYALPGRFLLSVGTVEERKNLMLTVQAMAEGGLDIDLVVCGRRTPYADRIRRYIGERGMAHRVHFRDNVEFADLPAIYQSGEILIYASIFEGFGIPILEGLNSGIPVITSAGGVFPETGGDAAWYVDPRDPHSLLEAIRTILDDHRRREGMIERGYDYALRFREERIAPELMQVYHKTI